MSLSIILMISLFFHQHLYTLYLWFCIFGTVKLTINTGCFQDSMCGFHFVWLDRISYKTGCNKGCNISVTKSCVPSVMLLGTVFQSYSPIEALFLGQEYPCKCCTEASYDSTMSIDSQCRRYLLSKGMQSR